jgi:hypothetical protein
MCAADRNFIRVRVADAADDSRVSQLLELFQSGEHNAKLNAGTLIGMLPSTPARVECAGFSKSTVNANGTQGHLGIDPTPTDYKQPAWRQAAGPTVFTPFPMDTKYLWSPQQAWMVNFRVRSLDAMVAQLRASGIAVEIGSEDISQRAFCQVARSGWKSSRTVGTRRAGCPVVSALCDTRECVPPSK